MFDYIDFTESDGQITRKHLLLFTLTTCPFCAEAVEFLGKNDLRFYRVDTDELPVATKRELRNEFIRTFKRRLYYPTLVIDQRKVLSGFEIEEWREELEVKDN